MTVPTRSDRPDPEQAGRILEERARILARPAAEKSHADQLELLVFTLSGESYALEARSVREVTALADFTPVPGASRHLLGITNLRGEILPVFDLRGLTGLEPTGVTDLSRLVVLGEDRDELGLLADHVGEVRAVAPGEIFDPPETLSAAGRGLLRGVTRDAVMVLDAGAVLRDPRLSGAENRSVK
ncbi:MAG: chemotaxis protein CheW [Myxococcales bacterium]|nr:chemotaxis protein CheW [Myxococcales bacterium]